MVSLNNCTDDISLWHSRLGHLSNDVLKHITCIGNKNYGDLLCDICPLAKQTRLPFHSSNNTSSDLFDLIHVDVWGPYRQPSLTGACYFLTIVYDFSRTTWTFLMKTKSQSVSILKKLFIMIQNQLKKNVKILRSDNGSEFVNKECGQMLGDFGILHQKTCVYTPQKKW